MILMMITDNDGNDGDDYDNDESWAVFYLFHWMSNKWEADWPAEINHYIKERAALMMTPRMMMVMMLPANFHHGGDVNEEDSEKSIKAENL